MTFPGIFFKMFKQYNNTKIIFMATKSLNVIGINDMLFIRANISCVTTDQVTNELLPSSQIAACSK